MKKVLIAALLAAVLMTVMISCGNEKTAEAPAAKTETAAAAEKAPAKPERIISIDSTTIEGEPISDDFYLGYDIILVNMMSTTCPPCVKEIPELQEIHEEDNGFGVVGVVADTFDRKTGERVDANVGAAVDIKTKTGAEYPFIIPTADLLTVTMGKLAPVFPMSFIVDNTGRVVKGPIAGARSKAEWITLLEEARKAL